jgi:histidinol-phosphatase (PHP family)
MKFDYHMHTPLCHHAKGEPREYVQAAMAVGLSEIGFSDHNPMPTQFDEWRMAPEDLSTYFKMIKDVQGEFSDFPIKLGLECDYIQGYEDHIRWLSQQADFDYLIGSVHYITPDWDVDNPYKLDKWKEHAVEDVWRMYFEEYLRMAKSRLFDFLGHPDLVKKFAIKPEGDLKLYYGDVLDAIADYDQVIEINTAGLRKEVKEMYPSRDFLEEAFKRNIPLLINSDAHQPCEVGYAYDDALKSAWSIGYRNLVRFEKRERISVPIEKLG